MVSEKSESIALARWLEKSNLTFIHVPNEGRRSPRGGAILKRMGLKKGFPDFLIFDVPPGREVKGVAVELKTPKGRLTRDQQRWLRSLRNLGWIALSGDYYDIRDRLEALYRGNARVAST